MRRGFAFYKRVAICIGALTFTIGTLSGCRYSSVDEYLEALGMKDLEEYVGEPADYGITYETSEEAAAFESSEQTAASYEDTAVENEENNVSENAADGEAADYKYSSYYKSLNTADNASDEMQEARRAVGLDNEGISRLKKQQKGLYAFERLTEEGKTLYVELLAIMQNQATDVLVSTTSDEAVELVFDYVMADHPEIFYVDGFQYTNYTIDGTITKIAFSGNYIYDETEVAKRQEAINAYVGRCLANAPSSDDDYYAIKYVYEYLIENTEYALDSADNQNICSVFIDGKSVCNGYSKAAQYLLNKLGIPCTLVTGTVDTKSSKGVRHAWNLVLSNDAYYYMDVTWGDSSYQTTNGESADATRLPAVNYDYLCVTTEDISTNHKISDVIDMPLCTSMADNYYVREDEYFVSAEMSLIKDLFDRRYKDGSTNVTMKCASREVYDSIFEQLITNRGVFEMLQSDTSVVSYTTFADTGTIIFWI